MSGVDWENLRRSAEYRPGRGESVVAYKDLIHGYTYSHFREYHGPWPAPPREAYGPPQPTPVQVAQDILSRYGIELEVDNGNYAESAARVTLRYKGETVLDDFEWTDWW
jgi:hypothetical protein